MVNIILSCPCSFLPPFLHYTAQHVEGLFLAGALDHDAGMKNVHGEPIRFVRSMYAQDVDLSQTLISMAVLNFVKSKNKGISCAEFNPTPTRACAMRDRPFHNTDVLLTFIVSFGYLPRIEVIIIKTELGDLPDRFPEFFLR